MQVGEWIRQGDVYVIRVDEKTPKGDPLGTRQVALGTSNGSRHVADGPRVEVFRAVGASEFDYCVVTSPEWWALTHPEHAHFELPCGTYLVRHQRDIATRRRVAD
jgi:hypothetical protein